MADATIDLLKNSSYVGKMDELIAAVKLGGGATSDVAWDNVLDKPTTIAGYGITDAKIENGTITLGNQTITPLTSAPVTSVNSKTGAVTLSATDVSAIPSTLTGTAGQVLTKTADGQEWKDVDIPTALPNPNALTFTGAVTGSYDGSEALTVEIPSGGGGSNLPIPTAEDVGKVPVVQGDLSFGLGEMGGGDWEVIADQTLVEEAASVSFDFDVTYRRLRFIVYGVPASGSNATLDVRFNGSLDKQRIQLSNGLQSFNTSDGVNKRAAQIYLEKINGYIAFALCSVNSGNENPSAMMYSPSIDSKKVDWIDISKVVFYAANTSFSAGSIFKLWGCK